MRLVGACWRAAVGRTLPLVVVLLVSEVSNDGFSWGGLAGNALTWSILSLCWAGAAWGSLCRRARPVGIGLTVTALEEEQACPMWADEGDRNLVLDRLKACERAFLVLEPARDEVTFRWRTGRRPGQSVRGSLTFDPVAGTVLVDVRGGEDHLGVAGLFKGAAFVALCRIAGELGLTGDKGRRRVEPFRPS